MPVEITEDWLDILDTTNYAPLKDPDNTYQSYRNLWPIKVIQ